MKRSSRWVLAASAAGGLAATALGVVSLAGATTPEQAAADAAPPPAGFVTTEVEFGTLSETLTLRADPVAVDGEAVLASPRDGVVTGHCPAGETLADGEVVCEVNGEPVVLADFGFAPYRDITGGSDGPDVEELQRLLARMGQPVEDDGKFGPRTQAAAVRAFGDLGYTLPNVLTDFENAVRGAEAAVEAAEAALTNASQPQAVDDGTSTPPDRAAVKVARRAVEDARRSLREIRLDGGPYVPATWLLQGPAGSATVGHQQGTSIVVAETPLVVPERKAGPRYTVTLPPGVGEVADSLTFTTDVGGRTIELTPAGEPRVGDEQTEGVRLELTGPPDAGLGSDRSLVVETVAGGDTTPGLIVPDAGIYVREGGTLAVAIPAQDDDAFAYVPVRVIQSGSGRSLVEPTEGSLDAGDLVILSIGQLSDADETEARS